MISTLILLLAVRWWRQPQETRWPWMLAALMPLALGLSYPAIFVAGGASVAMSGVAIRSRRAWASWLAYNAAIVASFLGWYWFAVRAQSQAELGVMTVCWNDNFPPLDSLGKLAGWLVAAHAGPLLAVPVGGDHCGSIGTLLLCIVAAAVLVRQRRYRLLLLCAAPFALNLLAAALRRYPYGGHMRLTMYDAPIVSILAGIGACWLVGRAKRRESHQTRLVGLADPLRGCPVGPPYLSSLRVILAMLLLLTIATAARDIYLPGKGLPDIRKRDFAAWFWPSLMREHEVLCTARAMPAALPSLDLPGRGIQAPHFRCNARIYSPRYAGASCYLVASHASGRWHACNTGTTSIHTTRPPLPAGWRRCNRVIVLWAHRVTRSCRTTTATARRAGRLR